MHPSAEPYLNALREALAEADAAQVRQALREARAALEEVLESLSWERPGLPPEETEARLESALGSPGRFAARFAAPTDPIPRAMQTAKAWPGFFEVLKEPRAYTGLLFLGLLFPIGILAFTWVSTLLSLSIGLLALFIGFPLLILTLASCRALGSLHGRLLEALTGFWMPRSLEALPKVPGFWKKLGALFTEGLTWRSIGLLLLLLPLGITYFTLVLSGLTLALALMLLPLATLSAEVGMEGALPLWAAGGISFLGALLLVALLHLSLALGRFHAHLSRRVLLGA